MSTTPQPFVIDLNEQASGGYWGRLLDETENLVPGSLLTTLTLTLYVINADNTITIVNSRNKQNVLNANDVQVFNTLQSFTKSDGTVVTYNLFWQIRQGDTTLVNSNLSHERHIGLFEWSWPNNHFGKHLVILSVENLVEVP